MVELSKSPKLLYSLNLRCIYFSAILFAAVLLATTRCARMGHPEGGPRDSAPPILLRTIPKYGATNFKRNKLRLVFNEYVVLKDQTKQFVMSPPPEKQPTLMIRGKNVVVEFNSKLADSTTYLLNFGNAIVDNNEGNVFPNYRFAFATGTTLDSMRMTGRTIDAATGEPLVGAIVCLYSTENDSVIVNSRPNSVARSDKWGFFVFENIKPIPYKVVALTDENRNYKYDAGQEAIGFFDGTINPAELYPPLQWLTDTTNIADTGSSREPQFVVRTFTEDVKKQFLMSAQRTQRKAFTLLFNAPFPKIDSMTATGVDMAKIVAEHSAKHDSTTFWLRDTAASLPDSMWLSFRYMKPDSSGNLVWERERHKLFFDVKKQTAQQQAQKNKDKKKGGIGSFIKGIVGIADSDTIARKPAHWTLKPTISASHSPIAAPTLRFNAPLFAINYANISIEEIRVHPKRKDTTYVALRFALTQDTLRLRHYTLTAAWKAGETYRYRILPDAFIDIYGQTNDTLIGTINGVKAEQVASLSFKCKNVEQQYVLQLTDSKGVVLFDRTISSDSSKPVFSYLVPAVYRVRAIKDDNRNGRWDGGNYFQHSQPEYAVFLKNADGTNNFTLKANWEQELNVDMAALFPVERLRAKDMEFPFTTIFTDSVEYVNFCEDIPAPKTTIDAEDWLLFCDDDTISLPEVTTETEDWTIFCDDSDMPQLSTEQSDYIEFCNDVVAVPPQDSGDSTAEESPTEPELCYD